MTPGQQSITDHMLRQGVPYTRENWIKANWSDVPKEWTAEHEAELPPDLRK